MAFDLFLWFAITTLGDLILMCSVVIYMPKYSPHHCARICLASFVDLSLVVSRSKHSSIPFTPVLYLMLHRASGARRRRLVVNGRLVIRSTESGLHDRLVRSLTVPRRK